MPISYKDSGVDRDLGDKFVSNISKLVKSTYNKKVKSGVGGYASLYEIEKNRFLAAGTDGVGTKLKIAQDLNIHDTIGIDLVAMCVNDVICTGAKPEFFLDYIACGKLNLKTSQNILKGIVEGCRESRVALVGGETAEMPGMYDTGEYDLAGFCVGYVDKKNLVDGKNMKEGDILIGLASSGLHSNGFSLVRKLIKKHEKSLLRRALAPTAIYVDAILEMTHRYKKHIKGLAHITGSGFLNIPRMNAKFDYHVCYELEKSLIFSTLHERSGLDLKEMYATFNMGVGFVICCSPESAKKILKDLRKKKVNAFPLGHVKKGKGIVKLYTDQQMLELS
ncbi:MAG: phosphoribosylformylglycinamidine cyclo-ligase [Oligoflexia bacterium]|nr:phosphoribosylformylglycinamidine cyclo-ligase [Oligoflexia bacterium]